MSAHVRDARRSFWPTRPLGDVFDVVGGGTPSKNESSYYNGKIPWATIRDMNSPELVSTEHTITVAGLRSSSSRVVRAGEVIMASRVGLGKACILGQDTAINQDIRALIPRDGNSINRRFCLYWLQSIADEIVAAGTGATVKGIKLPFIKSLSFPTIRLDEQKRIVAVLDRAFAALDRARANAEANLADAVELKERSVEHELSLETLGPPVSVGPHVNLLTGFAFKSGGYSDDPRDIRLLRGDNIVQGAFRWDGVKRWPIRERDAYEKYELALDDVLIAMDRTWVSAGIKHVIVDHDALPSLLVQRVARLRAKPSLIPRYLGYWIGSKIFERYVLSIQTGLGVPHVSGGQIENFRVRVPSIDRQAAIVERLDAIVGGCGDLVKTYSRKLADLAALRQSLLQKAFAGELS